MQTPITHAGDAAHQYFLPRRSRDVVVVIDEDADTQRILGSWLGAAGFTVVVAADARDAESSLAGRRPDVVISELRGRQVDSAVLVDGILATPSLAAAPLIVHTSRVAAADRALAGAVGDLVISKPSRLVDVLAAVRRVMSAPPDRDDEGEAAAGVGHAPHLDPSPVSRGDAVGDEQPQARSPLQ